MQQLQDKPHETEIELSGVKCLHPSTSISFDKAKREVRCMKCGAAWSGPQIDTLYTLLKTR